MTGRPEANPSHEMGFPMNRCELCGGLCLKHVILFLDSSRLLNCDLWRITLKLPRQTCCAFISVINNFGMGKP